MPYVKMVYRAGFDPATVRQGLEQQRSYLIAKKAAIEEYLARSPDPKAPGIAAGASMIDIEVQRIDKWLERLPAEAREPLPFAIRVYRAYEVKDELKERGYHYSGSGYWYLKVKTEEAASVEREWLASIGVTEVSARVDYEVPNEERKVPRALPEHEHEARLARLKVAVEAAVERDRSRLARNEDEVAAFRREQFRLKEAMSVLLNSLLSPFVVSRVERMDRTASEQCYEVAIIGEDERCVVLGWLDGEEVIPGLVRHAGGEVELINAGPVKEMDRIVREARDLLKEVPAKHKRGVRQKGSAR